MWGSRIADFFNYPMKLKLFGLTETNLFHFHTIFKKRGGEGSGSSEPPLDPPLLAAKANIIISQGRSGPPCEFDAYLW